MNSTRPETRKKLNTTHPKMVETIVPPSKLGGEPLTLIAADEALTCEELGAVLALAVVVVNDLSVSP